MKINNGVILGMFAGAAVGTIAGLLMAPDKGSKTLKKLNRKGKKTLENLGSQFSDIAGNISERIFGESNLNRKDKREDRLERTRSAASQFNSR